MIAIKCMKLADAIQLVEGCEKVDGGVVTYITERNTMRCEIAIFQCAASYVLVQMDMDFPMDNPLLIEWNSHLLIRPSDYAEILADYCVEVDSLLGMSNMLMAAVALFIKGENV